MDSYTLNVLAYILNTVITYGFGALGWMGAKTNSELSEKYQTLVTPAGWAFAIWGIIFTAQLIWVVSGRPEPVQAKVGNKYLFVCLAQSAWTIAFGQEWILASEVCMLAILYFLLKIVNSLTAVEGYFGNKFAFSIHFSWILAATAVNSSLVLVAGESSAKAQYAAAIVSLGGLLVLSLYFLLQHHVDYTRPLVVVWALAGVYAELSSPDDKIVARFTTPEIQSIRYGALLAALYISLCSVARGMHVLVIERPTSKSD